MYGDMGPDVLRRLENVLPHLCRVDLNGHGEPLLYPLFLDLLARLKARGLYVGITSNATLIDEDIAKGMVALGLDELCVSIHAAREPLYSKISKGARLERVVENLNLINKHKGLLSKKRPKICFHFVGMRQNIDQLPDLIRLAKDLRVDNVTVLVLAEYPLVEGQSLVAHKEYARSFFEDAIRVSRKRRVELSIPSLYFDHCPDSLAFNVGRIGPAIARLRDRVERRKLWVKLREFYWTRRKWETETGEMKRDCYDPWTFCFVLQNGDIRPCCVSERRMGNILDADFESIWNGEKYEEFRNQIIGGHLPEECAACKIRPWVDSAKWRQKWLLCLR
jgi:radical SAM protein with 4Fe4S-binding SPASM domain